MVSGLATRLGHDLYAEARHCHAWMLRAEGLSMAEIGSHLGVTDKRASQLVRRFGKKMTYALRHASFQLVQ